LVVIPAGNAEPLDKPDTKNVDNVPEQLSLAVAFGKNAKPLQGIPVPITTAFGGQVTTGGWLSTTVTTIVQRRVLPAASVAWKTTFVLPTGKVAPLDKPLTRVDVPVNGPQLSVKVGLVYVTTALHTLGAVLTLMAGGQVIVGTSLSFTVTLNVQVLVNPPPSVALQVTVVFPFWKVATLLAPLAVGIVPPLTHWGCPTGKPQLSAPFGEG
jgi:hypothetical protein